MNPILMKWRHLAWLVGKRALVWIVHYCACVVRVYSPGDHRTIRGNTNLVKTAKCE